jgi:hypothetical protein
MGFSRSSLGHRLQAQRLVHGDVREGRWRHLDKGDGRRRRSHREGGQEHPRGSREEPRGAQVGRRSPGPCRVWTSFKVPQATSKMSGQATHTVGPLGGRHLLHDELRPTL